MSVLLVYLVEHDASIVHELTEMVDAKKETKGISVGHPHFERNHPVRQTQLAETVVEARLGPTLWELFFDQTVTAVGVVHVTFCPSNSRRRSASRRLVISARQERVSRSNASPASQGKNAQNIDRS